jgi:hypothetical protein
MKHLPVSIAEPCVGLIPQPRSSTKCLWIEKSITEGQGPIRTVESSGKNNIYETFIKMPFATEARVSIFTK